MSVTLNIVEEGIAILQVSRPQVRNALDWRAMQVFSDCVDQAHNQSDLRALILTGTRGAFISGGDLKVLAEYTSRSDGQRLAQGMSRVLNALERLPCPTIAALDGPARGGGAEISLACDLRILAQDADLGFVQVTLGLTPGWGAGQRLLRLVGYSRALEWLATGRILSSEEAETYGLASQVTPAGGALSAALKMARRFASQPAAAVQTIKRILRVGLSQPGALAAAFEQAEFPLLWESEAHLQAVARFLSRGSDVPS